MKTLLSLSAGRLPAWLAATAVALLAACGGGGGVDVAGVGSGGSGVASGSVSGFGSVIVDGVEYDDSSATRDTVDAGGASVNAAVKLGQRVRLVYSGDRVAQRIEVQAQLVGPVSAAPAADGMLAVMGQPVRIVTGSADATRSSPTVLDGYATTADIRAGDDVEVHGAWAYDATLAASVLVATRVEKRADRPDPVLLGGVVTAIDGLDLRLNSATGSVVRAPSPTGVAVDDVVRVWAARAALAASPVAALRVAGPDIGVADVAANASVSLSGLASRYDAATRTVEVQGVRVKLADGVAVDEGALARGEFVSLRLGKAGTTLVASAVGQRSGGADLGRTVEVKGVTRGVDWSAASVSFNLRGTPIQAAAAVVADSCRAAAASADLFVEVRGTLTGAGTTVTATEVKCSAVYAGTATSDFTGALVAIDPAARTLSLLVDTAGRVVAARWDERTYFEQPPASLPIGLRIEVEGVMDKGSTTLRLNRVEVAD